MALIKGIIVSLDTSLHMQVGPFTAGELSIDCKGPIRGGLQMKLHIEATNVPILAILRGKLDVPAEDL